MIMAGDFRNGTTFEMDGQVYKIVEFQHVKPGKGAAFVRTKLKNVMNGSVLEKTFNPTEKYENAQVERKEMQYLYEDSGLYYFMDTETYEQEPLNKEQLGDALMFVKENMNVSVLMHDTKVIGCDLPTHVELEVVDTPPAEKGNTAQGGTKPATTETGAIVNVPFFVQNGDRIRVDTRTNEYLDRC